MLRRFRRSKAEMREQPVRTVQDVQGNFNAMVRGASAFDQNLKLRQDPNCEQPYTNLGTGTVHVPKLQPYWSDEKVRIWRGYTIHEIGHHAPEVQDTKDFMLTSGVRYDTPFGKIMNVFDDVRNELNPRIQQFKGFKEALSWTQGFHALQGIKGIKAGSYDPSLRPFLDAIALAYHYRATVQPHVAYPAGLWEAEGFGVKYYHLLPRLEALRTIEDVYELAKEFLDPDESEGDEQGEEGDPEKGEDEAESSGGDPEKGEDEGEEPGDSTGEKGEDDGESGEARDGEVSYKDILAHEHTDNPEAEPNAYDFKITYDHERSDDFVPHSDINVTNAKDLPDEQRNVYRSKSESLRVIGEHITNGQKLSGKVRREFQAKAQTRVTHNHRTGRLDKRDLYRVPSGGRDVFKRKEHQVSMKGIAVHLLGDASGSMTGDPWDCMSAALVLLSECLTPLGIPVKLSVFTEIMTSEHFIIKDWQEKPSRETMVERFYRVEDSMGMNCDGESVMWAAKDLLKRPEERKLLIVMSDGQPASNASGDCWTYTRDVVAQVSKKVETYGIGIMSESVKDFYPKYSVLQSAEELEACLLNVMRQKVLGELA